jgi:hypothetical protein
MDDPPELELLLEAPPPPLAADDDPTVLLPPELLLLRLELPPEEPAELDGAPPVPAVDPPAFPSSDPDEQPMRRNAVLKARRGDWVNFMTAGYVHAGLSASTRIHGKTDAHSSKNVSNVGTNAGVVRPGVVSCGGHGLVRRLGLP